MAAAIHQDLILPATQNISDDSSSVPLCGSGGSLVLDPDAISELEWREVFAARVVGFHSHLVASGCYEFPLVPLHHVLLRDLVEGLDCWEGVSKVSTQEGLANGLACLGVDGVVPVGEGGLEVSVSADGAVAVGVAMNQLLGGLHCALCLSVGLGVVG